MKKDLEGAEGRLGRFRWLDIARAAAVFFTALMHLSDETWPSARWFGRHIVNPGIFGIVLFFLISGFVIPLTLERRGSLVAFAIARVFRLYPLYWFSLVALLALHAMGRAILPADFAALLPSSAWWNATMIQSWVGVPDAIGLYWTLGYEVGFYVAAALLFAFRIHRHTDWLVAIGAVYFLIRGVIRPVLGLGPHYDPSEVWKLTFFVGTLWYRVFAGAIRLRRAVLLTLLLGLGVVGSYWATYGYLDLSTSPPVEIDPRGWIFPYASLGATALAYVVFILLFLTKVGEGSVVLTWLGRVSYSVYLLHGLLLLIPLPVTPALAFALRLAALPVICALTYRYVETPPIALGHRVIERLGFSGPRSRASIAPVMATSETTAVPVTAPTKQVATASTSKLSAKTSGHTAPRNIVGVAVAAGLIGVAAGYFLHTPAQPAAGFFNFDKETTPKERLVRGWSGYELMPEGDTFVWCQAKACVLRVDTTKADHAVRARAFAYSFPGAPPQTMNVFVNGALVGSRPVTGAPSVLKFDAPAGSWKDGPNELRFEFAYAEMPKDRIPGSQDPRALSAAFDWVDVVPLIK